MRPPRGALLLLSLATSSHGQDDKRNNSGFKIPIQNDKERGGYFMNVTIGTPGQELALQLDTGSSDVWVPSSNAKLCREQSGGGCSLGSFNVEESETFDNDTNSLFAIAYQDQSSSRGTYFKDQFLIGMASLPQFTMGLGARTTIPYGLAGVGYASDEAALATTRKAYPNLPLALQQAGFIEAAAYSLWLNDLDASTGNILFGAIDTEEYVGELKRIPVLPDSATKKFTSFLVSMYSLEARSTSGSDFLTSNELPLPVVLDSGTTFTYLPQSLADQVWEEVGARWEPQVGLALLPCSYANHPGHFSFNFAGPDGPRVNVTMTELVVPFTSGDATKFESGPYQGQSACAVGILNQTGPPYLLGDTFLRSAYVVYDMSNNEIGIAPTNFNTSKSNIVPFPSNGATIPSATAVPNEPTRPQLHPARSPMKAARGFQTGQSTASQSSLSMPGSIVAVILTVLFHSSEGLGAFGITFGAFY
ncbi:putative aspartyl protease [Ophiocordyceps polyrhachis-furcata BCC 54312]|uniref:Aspartyl protease n=1 Tax=Ophiocordyceps polyrhachis-furcata BCC 54312 TaxID=1330021 RepID=A0A367LBZ0_9HYPO|nr:putative aspartyl protease [Ophiocordyceps polyrhachis-furcata BCC 54312]